MQNLLKFITCGSVDDGKSTLIGRLLYDAKLIYADQEQALELDSKVGSADGEIDYALLLDGLMAEREQGITIDVAYRYFTTDRRSFIVADTPGHEEYTRNMAVGASFAELAVILIDATKGVLIQTKRHTRICNMMGIKHVVYVVNKMDLVDYKEEIFRNIEKSIIELTEEISFETRKIIPVSAKRGENLTKKSENLDWYKTETLLDYLETINVEENKNEQGFLMPVQRVCRPNEKFRGFQGQIEMGNLRMGDEIVALPSEEAARVKEIWVGDKNCEEACKGQPVTISLDREIDISRGCVLKRDIDISLARLAVARMLWLDEQPLMAGKNYYVKLGTKMMLATILKIKNKVGMNDGEKIAADHIIKNEIVDCEIQFHEKMIFDKFENNKELGSFILIDQLSHATSACGIIKYELRRDKLLYWQKLDIDREQRAKQKAQKPYTIWLTGLSGAGKSTIANALEKRLYHEGKHTMLLDGDNVRMGLNCDLGFKDSDRIENIRRVAEVAKLMNDAGLIVIVSFISPFETDRKKAKEVIGEDAFCEVYVNTSLEECEKRDVKGLYKKARAGQIPNFSGITSPYEVPEDPDIILDTEKHTVEELVEAVLSQLS